MQPCRVGTHLGDTANITEKVEFGELAEIEVVAFAHEA
jgi:hypothetical protein